MFDGLTPEAKALLEAAGADLPTAKADAGLLRAMAEAVSVGAIDAPSPLSRRRPMLGKVLTAKAAAIAGVLVLSGGVASAATGSLPEPAQDAVAAAAERVGFDLPASGKDKAHKEDKADKVKTDDDADSTTEEDGVKAEHPENHGKDVSSVARDPANAGPGHGAAVCTVASDGKCKAGQDKPTPTTTVDDDSTDEPEQGKSAGHRKDGEHRKDKPAPTSTTTTPSTTTTTTIP